MARNTFRAFAKTGKALGLAKKLHKIYERLGLSPMAVDEYATAVKAGRVQPGTFAFAVVDKREAPPRFLGTVVVEPDMNVFFEGEFRAELEDILTSG